MKPRDVTIKTVLNGWIVEVGCQTVVFTSMIDMQNTLRDYLQSPKKTEDKYFKESINAEFFSDGEVQLVDEPQGEGAGMPASIEENWRTTRDRR